MFGLNLSPSSGFWSKFAQQTPSMVNAFAQNFGDPSMQGANRAAGSAFGMMRQKKQPTNSIPKKGTVKPPSNINIPPVQFGGKFGAPNTNTGINGGAMDRRITPKVGGMWDIYNQMNSSTLNNSPIGNRQIYF